MIVFVSVVFFFAIFCAILFVFPQQSLIIQSNDEALLEEIKNHLKSQGVDTFIKNSINNYQKKGLNEAPSLHVSNSS